MASRHFTYLNEAQSVEMPPGDNDQDQPAMQEAIEQSLRARDNIQETPFHNPEARDRFLPTSTFQNRVSIDDIINDMTMKAVTGLPVVHDPQGDTLIYIDVPQRQPEQDEHEYERYIKRYAAPMLMRKETLTKYSPGLAKLFGPTQQHRFVRRRKLANKLPRNVKYVIDLTPPSEGEDAVFLTTELCCSEGVRLWHQSNQIWHVSKTLVKGQEEFFSTSPNAASGRFDTVQGTSDGNATPSATLPLEYSPVRHRSAIERVLTALQGKDPLLDSATKVWTTFAVAKNFEITHSPLEDYVIRWLRAYPNSYFLEVLPEVSHQIADGLQNYDLARDTFAILVGEEALDSLRYSPEPGPHKYTTFGRKKEGLPEHIRTRIEYASKSFLERINNDFAYLAGNDMQWVDGLPEMSRLSSYTQPEIQNTVRQLNDLLKDFVRGAIYKPLCVDYDTVPGPDVPNDGGHDLLPRVDRAAVWANMPLGKRILSRTYWEALTSCNTLQGVLSNLDFHKGWNLKGGLDSLSQTEKRELDRGTYREVTETEIRAVIRNGQTHLNQASTTKTNIRNTQHDLNAKHSSAWVPTLPDRTLRGTPAQDEPNDLMLTHVPDQGLYNAQQDSGVKLLPKQPYNLPDRTKNGTQDATVDRKAPIPTPAQPVDVPKPLKRTQDFPGALSPPDKKFQFDIRRKWPFGAARDDPLTQVQKSVDGLHFSSVTSDIQPATDMASEQAANPGFNVEEVPTRTGIDPWRGYSDYLSHAANETWRHLEPKPESKQHLEDSVHDHFVTRFFNLEGFLNQARKYIDTFAMNKLRSSNQLELGLTNTLVCLEDSEWKYLPLYAGGNDDGSMGVFNDDLPTADHGFTTAGPEVHDGSTPANSIEGASEFDFVSIGESASTFNASTATNRGFSDTVRRGRVHAADSADGSMSDDFTIVTASVDNDDEETFARQQIEARERREAAEEAAANEAHRIVEGEDESYADLFAGEEEDDGSDTDRAETNDDDEDEDEDEEDMVMV